MKKYHIIILSLFLSLLAFSGCKSSKSAGESENVFDTTPETILKELSESYKAWDTFACSGKLSISGALTFSTSVQVKMVHDKCISLSIRPILGIEAAKVFIDKDSAVIIDKYHKVYTTVELSKLAHILPVNIGTVQDILLSRIFSLKDGTLTPENTGKFKISANAVDGSYIIKPKKKQDGFTYEFALNKDRQPKSLDVYPSKSQKSYSARYSDFDTSTGIAENITAETSVKGKNISLKLYLNSSKVKWDGNVEENVSINKSYRKVSISELLTILKSF